MSNEMTIDAKEMQRVVEQVIYELHIDIHKAQDKLFFG